MDQLAVEPRLDVTAYVQQALISHQKGHLEEAGRLYHRALASDPHQL